MITANNQFVIKDDSEKMFSASAKITCQPTYFKSTEMSSVTVIVLNSSTDLEEDRTVIDLTKDELAAETASETGELDNWFKVVQEAVVTKLESFSGNSGVTFTTSV